MSRTNIILIVAIYSVGIMARLLIIDLPANIAAGQWLSMSLFFMIHLCAFIWAANELLNTVYMNIFYKSDTTEDAPDDSREKETIL